MALIAQARADPAVLSAMHAVAGRDGTTRLVLTLGPGIPQKWSVSGQGSTDVTITLPKTTLSPLITGGVPSVNALDRVTTTASGGDLYVTLHLIADVPITVSTRDSLMLVNIAAAKIKATPAPVQTYKQRSAHTPYESGHVFDIVRLKYADVSEVVGVLVEGQHITPNDIFETQGSIFTLPTSATVSSPMQAPQGYAPSTTAPESRGLRINDNIAVDRRLNAVILSGSPELVSALEAEIAKIDVPLPAVMLECQVVELTETAAHDLGLDYAPAPGAPIATGGLSILTGQTPQFHATFQASLFATIAKGGGKLLATPRVLAVDGLPAQILTGEALPIIQSTIFPGTPTVTQVTTTYIAVGVNLQIQSHVAPGGFVTSHVFAEVSSVTAFISTSQGNVPQISLRQANTSATVGDGTPFVVGGLLRDEEISNMSKLPLLGDMPLLGGLFRSRHDSSIRQNLYIIVTPHVIQPAHPSPKNP
jgi:general secretion pathway protein D